MLLQDPPLWWQSRVAVVARDSYRNMENGRYIDRTGRWARDRSLRMRRYERIDRVAVYQKCIKINAGAYYFCWNTRAFIARSVRRFIRGGICNANRATQNKARVHAAKPPRPGLLVLAYIVTRTFLLTHPTTSHLRRKRAFHRIKLSSVKFGTINASASPLCFDWHKFLLRWNKGAILLSNLDMHFQKLSNVLVKQNFLSHDIS